MTYSVRGSEENNLKVVLIFIVFSINVLFQMSKAEEMKHNVNLVH